MQAFSHSQQHGLLHGHTCTRKLLLTADSWTSVADKGGKVDAVYLESVRIFDLFHSTSSIVVRRKVTFSAGWNDVYQTVHFMRVWVSPYPQTDSDAADSPVAISWGHSFSPSLSMACQMKYDLH
ncbi:hypothetical protein AHF37_04195 [Paragonimus kellicotti]|nr:hypothetical protein AHF37_04195 [Paragonimus kellicotti]